MTSNCGYTAESPSRVIVNGKLAWLPDWLGDRRLSHHLEGVTAWCCDMGAAFPHELAEEWEALADDLCLTNSERQRVRPASELADIPVQPSVPVPAETSFASEAGTYRVHQPRLGKGGFGIVYRCTLDTEPAESLAVKIIRYSTFGVPLDIIRQELLGEAEVLLSFRHPNIVQFRDVIDDGTSQFLVMELAQFGDLAAYVGSNRAMSEAEAHYSFEQIVEGLKYIHSKNIIHRDLKLDNILISNINPGGLLDVKITDFGLAKRIRDGYSRADSTVGTRRYCAPEVLCAGDSQSVFRDELIGVWFYGVGNKSSYTISMTVDGLYEYHEISKKSLRGILERQSEWLVATLESGTIRLKIGSKPRTLMSNFREHGSTKWGKTVIASSSMKDRSPQPGEYSVVLNKATDMSLGVDISMDATTILIRDIKEGLIHDWNELRGNCRVSIGDRIVEANSIHGNGSQLWDECQKTGRLHLSLRPRAAKPAANLNGVVGGNGYDERADIWSLGVCLYVMLVGVYPFSDEASALEGTYSFRGSTQAKALLCGLLRVKPYSRWSMVEILSCPWMVKRELPPIDISQAETEQMQPCLIMRLPRPPRNVTLLQVDLRTYSCKHKVVARLQHLEISVCVGFEIQKDMLEIARRDLMHVVAVHLPEVGSQICIEERNFSPLDEESETARAIEKASLEKKFGTQFTELGKAWWRIQVEEGVALDVYLPSGYPQSEAPHPVIVCTRRYTNVVAITGQMARSWSPGQACVELFVMLLRDALRDEHVTNVVPQLAVLERSSSADKQDLADLRRPSLQLLRQSLQDRWRKLGKGKTNPNEHSVHIAHGVIKKNKKSKIQAHYAKVSSLEQVNSVYESLLYSSEEDAVVTHSIVAFRLWEDTIEEFVVDCDDNYNSGAGSSLAKLLEKRDANGTFIMVTQWFLNADKPYLGQVQTKRICNEAQFFLDAQIESSKPT